MTGEGDQVPALAPAGAGGFAVSGPVTFATAGRLLEEGNRQFTGQALLVDLAGVTDVDSAGLALLLEWLRGARAEGRGLRFVALPAKLLAIARLSGVDFLLADNYSVTGSGSSSSSASSSQESSSGTSPSSAR